MKSHHFVLWSLACFTLSVSLSSCSKTRNNSALAPFDKEKLMQFSQTSCSEGEVLEEVAMNSELTFDRLYLQGSSVFGFYNGEGRCAVTGEIHDTFPLVLDVGHFNLTLYTSCVVNGSLWKLTDYGTATPNTHLDFQGLEESNLQAEVHIEATRDLLATYARDHAGLRIFECK